MVLNLDLSLYLITIMIIFLLWWWCWWYLMDLVKWYFDLKKYNIIWTLNDHTNDNTDANNDNKIIYNDSIFLQRGHF